VRQLIDDRIAEIANYENGEHDDVASGLRDLYPKRG
jgi:hypothetical protein